MLRKYQPLLVGTFLISCLFVNGVLSSNTFNPSFTHAYDNGSKTLESLKNFALLKINADRKDYALSPLLLSNNSAAQIHANELLHTKTISHLTMDGFKPFMLYSLYNGTGYVQQNIGQISYVLPNDTKNTYETSNLCSDSKRFYCPVIDQYKAISDLENSMMYNDVACCNDGHKNNILNKFHTHVSIGIAFNEYYFVMVQNFENRYLDSDFKILKNKEDIKLEAKINETINFDFDINHVSFFLDEFPTKLNYEKYKDKNSYDFGDLKLMISKPLPSDLEYIPEQDTYKIIEAKKWEFKNDNINLEFQLPENLNVKDKVLTMVVYAQNIDSNNIVDSVEEEDNLDHEYIPITSYTFFNY